jgi:hypothetical protein
MILYTCAGQKHGGSLPLVQHPCGAAAKALDDGGHEYEIKVVGGFKNVPMSRRGKRDEIRKLTGQDDVPVLLTDDGAVIQGSKRIVAWATQRPASAAG